MNMKIFNEDMEKHLLFNNDSLLESKYALSIGLMSIVVFFSITIPITLIIKPINQTNLIIWSLIMLLIAPLLFGFLMTKIDCYIKIKLTSSHPPSNPILIKLKNADKKQDCVNLVKLWKHFNPDHPSDFIVLNKHQKDIELLQKLDDDLVHFIENADDVTIKLFNLEDFESYKQLYMKYIAPKQKEEILNKIQTLTKDLLNQSGLKNQTSHLLNQLQLLKSEIEKYDINIVDYFEFKKWHQETLDMLKVDKDNEMVKSNYKNIIQEINSSQKED